MILLQGSFPWPFEDEVFIFCMQVTYCPDCTRACKYDTQAIGGGGELLKGSDFYNYVFGCLFLDETRHVCPL